MSFNKVILLGNLTADPETRTTPNGRNITNFTVAVNRSYRGSDGERKDDVSYINCNAWGVMGENIAKYFNKGRQIMLSGRLQQRSWEDKDTGKRRYAIDVVVEEFSFTGNRSSDGGSSSSAGADSLKSSDNNIESMGDIDKSIELDDIPF